MSSTARSTITVVLAVAIYAAVAIGVVWLVSNSGTYPAGSDTMCHLYKGDMLYNAILQGDWYPLLDPMWYNGVEPMRYWAPLPVYALAGCQALAGGDLFGGYLLFVGLVAFLGALPWLLIGVKTKRRVLGAFLGLLWFFMPNNLTALFTEGNLPRSVALVMLPLLLYHVWMYLGDRRSGRLPIIGVVFALIALCHSGYAGMVALALLLFFAVWGIANRAWKPQLAPIAAILLGYGMVGLWLVPSLIGGISSMDSSEVMATFFQPAAVSLNPFDRIDSGYAHFYFGLAAFALAVLGALCSKRDSQPGFWTAVIIFVCTTTMMYPVLKILPGSQYLWMLRFISIALAFILLGFMFWRSMRAWIVVFACVLLVLDVVPSLPLLMGDGSASNAQERMEAQAEDTLIEQAQQITTQRCAILDESSLGATGPYLLSGQGDRTAGTFGAGYQSANTASNIVQLNRALDSGSFNYLFDRCLELGNDTVLVETRLIPATSSVSNLDSSAARLGYKVAAQNNSWRLYKLENAPDAFGTVSTYRAIGIGTGAPQISLQFPAVEESDSNNLNDYTYEQLSSYDIVYIDGASYDNRSQAEDLVRKLSEHGTRVVIAADGIPEDKESHDRVFLGVRCNTISFKGGYPMLDTIDGQLVPDLFPQGHQEWQTVYLEGLDECWGQIHDKEIDADVEFMGTVENDNIVMVGLNLTYDYALTRDSQIGMLLSHCMDLDSGELPQRDVVPLSIQYGEGDVAITAGANNVNTSLAYHDAFESAQTLRHSNNLLFVDKGTTTISMSYPYFYEGLATSAACAAFLVVLTVFMRRAERHRASLKCKGDSADNPRRDGAEREFVQQSTDGDGVSNDWAQDKRWRIVDE